MLLSTDLVFFLAAADIIEHESCFGLLLLRLSVVDLVLACSYGYYRKQLYFFVVLAINFKYSFVVCLLLRHLLGTS